MVEYRASIVAFLAKHDLRVSKHGITEMAEALMSEVYSESKVIYSGLAAAAHGYGWATSNFFSFADNDLRPDDQMLIEYHAYVVETTVVVVDRLVEAFRPEPPLRERWEQERDRVLMTLGWFIQNRDLLADKNPT